MMKKVGTPGGRNVIHKVARKTGSFVCVSCGSHLHGIRRVGTAKQIGWGSDKRVNRAFGGSMCPSCSRGTIRQRARNI